MTANADDAWDHAELVALGRPRPLRADERVLLQFLIAARADRARRGCGAVLVRLPLGWPA